MCPALVGQEGTFQITDAQLFKKIVADDSRLETIDCNFGDAEGPVWMGGKDGYLVFSDIGGDKLLKWTPRGGIETFREHSNKTNGNALDRNGALVSCEQATRRVVRWSADGGFVVLAAEYEGKKFNSPNDLAIRSDGTIWFTDPSYGSGFGPAELDGKYVFRIEPVTGKVTIASKEFSMPNGIVLSPDEKYLFIGQGGEGNFIKRFPVERDGSLGKGEVFCSIKGRVPDGLRLDSEGNLYVAGGDGVHIFSPQGAPIGVIRTGPRATNMQFGGADCKTLFITARNCLYHIRLNVAGPSCR
jgi:gluconolactonase